MPEASLARMFEAYSEVTQAVSEATSIEDVLDPVVREGARLIGVERCGAYIREERQSIFRARSAIRDGVALPEDIKRWLAGVPADGLTSEAVKTQQPVIVPNARQDPRMIRAAVRRWSIRSIMAVPMVLDDEVLGLLLMDDVDRRREFTQSDAELARIFAGLAATSVSQARERLELRSKLDLGNRQLHAVRRATSIDEQLAEILLEGRSLQDLTNNLSELLGKPCAVVRADGKSQAAAAPAGVGEDLEPNLLKPEVAARPEVRAALAEQPSSRAFVVGPIPSAGVLRRHLVAPVLLGDQLWGRLVVMEEGAKFAAGDVAVARRAAILVALLTSTERRWVEADWNAGSLLAAELLGGSADAEVVKRRANRLGVNLDARRVVMVISSRAEREDDEPDARTVAASFSEHVPDLKVHVTVMAGAAVALIEVPRGEDSETFVARSRPVFETVRADLSVDEPLLAGVSEVRRWRDGYRTAYREARQVVQCLRRFSPPGGPTLIAAQDLGAGGLLLANTVGDAVADFAEETIGCLFQEQSKADLLVTLRAFFDNMGSIRATAAELVVHENTVRYRLARVEEVTGLAVMRDPEAQVGARLGMLVMLLQGRLGGIEKSLVAFD
jgi:GAF domain-containing protein